LTAPEQNVPETECAKEECEVREEAAPEQNVPETECAKEECEVREEAAMQAYVVASLSSEHLLTFAAEVTTPAHQDPFPCAQVKVPPF